jgi:hypothetical protein
MSGPGAGWGERRSPSGAAASLGAAAGDLDNCDECPNSCVFASPRDGGVDCSEERDDGPETDCDDCANHCTLAVCGDGMAPAGEDRDDGNVDDTDSCTSAGAVAACGARADIPGWPAAQRDAGSRRQPEPRGRWG